MDVTKEIRDGQEVVVIPTEQFNSQFRKKRVSKKQRILTENNVDIKYLKNIQYKKNTDSYTLRVTNIPNLEELKKLIDIQESYPVIEEKEN